MHRSGRERNASSRRGCSRSLRSLHGLLHAVSEFVLTVMLVWFLTRSRGSFIGRCFNKESRLNRTVGVMPGQRNEADIELEELALGAESSR